MFAPAWPLPVVLSLAILASCLAICVVTDLRRRLIYDVVTLPSLLALLGIMLWAGGWPALGDSLIGVLVCAGPLLIAAYKEQMGMGDVKLMAVVGAAAGWPSSLACLLYVSVAGGVLALGMKVWAWARKSEQPKGVPYALAVAAGTCAAWLIGTP